MPQEQASQDRELQDKELQTWQTWADWSILEDSDTGQALLEFSFSMTTLEMRPQYEKWTPVILANVAQVALRSNTVVQKAKARKLLINYKHFLEQERQWHRMWEWIEGWVSVGLVLWLVYFLQQKSGV